MVAASNGAVKNRAADKKAPRFKPREPELGKRHLRIDPVEDLSDEEIAVPRRSPSSKKAATPKSTGETVGAVTIDGITLDDQAFDEMDDQTFAAFLAHVKWENEEADSAYSPNHRETVTASEQAFAKLRVVTRHQQRRRNADAIYNMARMYRDEIRMTIDKYRGNLKAKNPAKASSTETAKAARKNPTRLLYDHYKGQFLMTPEWNFVAMRGLLERLEEKTKADGKEFKLTAVGNLTEVLARLTYWSEPDKETGMPRAEDRYRVQDKDGIWWLSLSPEAIAKYLVLSKKAVLVAIKKLELCVVEVKALKEMNLDPTTKGRYGRNTRFVRLLSERIEPYVEHNMKKDPSRRGQSKKKEVRHAGH